MPNDIVRKINNEKVNIDLKFLIISTKFKTINVISAINIKYLATLSKIGYLIIEINDNAKKNKKSDLFC